MSKQPQQIQTSFSKHTPLTDNNFLSTLIPFAQASHSNSELHKLAQTLMQLFFANYPTLVSPTKTDTLEMLKVDNGMDTVCVVNGTYLVIVKVAMDVEEYTSYTRRFETQNILRFHYQNALHANYTKLLTHRYKVVDAQALCYILDNTPYSDVAVLEYHNTLSEQVKALESYKTAPVDTWNEEAYKGFFIALQKALHAGLWDYVGKGSSSYLGFWWGVSEEDYYMQIEVEQAPDKKTCTAKLCFKTSTLKNSKVDSVSTRKDLYRAINKQYPNCVEKPKRFTKAAYMYLAFVKEDFIKRDKNACIDMKETVQFLKSF